MNFTLADLSAFVAVAERCNFRAAAEDVHLSQPALSRRIEKLEEALGARLFERNTRRVTLTGVGRRFEPRARQLLHGLQEALLEVSDVASSQMPEVRIGCVSSAVRFLISEPLLAFRARHPRIPVKIVDGGVQDVLDAVGHGEVDFGLGFLGDLRADLAFRPVLSDPYVAICDPSHPLSKLPCVTWSDLTSCDYIAFDRNNANRAVIDAALMGRTLSKPVCEVRRMASLLALVEARVGVAAAPRLALSSNPQSLVVLPLIEPVVRRMFGVITRTHQTLPPAAVSFIEFFDEWSRSLAHERDMRADPPVVGKPRRQSKRPTGHAHVVPSGTTTGTRSRRRIRA